MMNNKEFEFISSRQNEKIKEFSKLADPKYRREYGLFLAEGVKLAEEAVESGAAKYLLILDSAAEDGDVKSVLDKSGAGVIKYILTAPVFEKVSTERAPQGIIAVCSAPGNYVCDAAELDGKRLIALDGIRDPGNLGTIIRTAYAFGYDAALLSDCADVYGYKTVRASMGAVFRLRAVECSDLASFLRDLKERGRRVLGAALNESSETFDGTGLDMTDVPVIGNEGHGISQSVLDVCSSFVKIPMNSRSESLNAAVAASVIMWEYSKLNGKNNER